MALDAMMADGMLGTYRNMLKEVEEKGLNSGEDYETMKATLQRMEDLAEEADPDMMVGVNWFNGKVMNENLYGTFGDAYGRVLNSAAGGNEARDTDDYDDGALLKQVLDGLRGSIDAIRKGKQDALEEDKKSVTASYQVGKEYLNRNAKQLGFDTSKKYYDDFNKEIDKSAEEVKQDELENPEHYSNAKEIEVMFMEEQFIAPIEALIKLGEEEGMTLPKFLRLQIERGMDKAAEGSFATREGLVIDIKNYNASLPNARECEMRAEFLELWDSMVPDAPFGVPDSLKFSLARRKIEHRFAPSIAEWKAKWSRFETLIDTLDRWVRAHTKYAMGMDPWCPFIPMGGPREKAIAYSKACDNGNFKVREELIGEYWDLDFKDIFNHETFIWEVNSHSFSYSQVYTEFLINEVYPICIPLQDPPKEIIEKCEKFYEDKLMSNPEWYKMTIRFKECYDEQFGEGRYEEKGMEWFDGPHDHQKNTPVWDLKSFQSGVLQQS